MMVKTEGYHMVENVVAGVSHSLQLNSIELFGSIMLAIVFNLFYSLNTQHSRFRLICWAFWTRSIKFIGLFIIPFLPQLNPAFTVSPIARLTFILGSTAVGSSFLLASLFPHLPKTMKYVGVPAFFTLILTITVAVLGFFVPWETLFSNAAPLMWSFSLLFASLAFFFIPASSKINLFSSTGKCLFTIAGYHILSEFNLLPTAWWPLPVLLYGTTIAVILFGQVHFVETTCLTLQEQLSLEQKKRYTLWDIAPFPIVITKLVDDQVLYINPLARNILGIPDTQLSQIHFADYFVDPTKRVELIALANKQTVVESFQIQAKSPATGVILWINLSARVLELDGELTLYINFIDITKAKETEQELFLQASTDTLTGLYNRRQFEAMTKQAFALHERTGNPFAVIMLDIDHFKEINDTYGHDAGDDVLKHLAQIMQQTMRQSDIIARFGGEEFIIFLMNTQPEEGLVAANKLRQAIEKATFLSGTTQIRVTVSLGISTSQKSDITALAKEADLALYYSKEHGRNQANLYTENMTTDSETIAKHTS